MHNKPLPTDLARLLERFGDRLTTPEQRQRDGSRWWLIADLDGADLRGATLTATHLEATNLTGARYDAHTRWPSGFDPEKAGAVRME
jgi:hypothetical protein